MRKNLSFLLILLSALVYSQTFDTKKLENIKARAIGPAGMSGRVTSIDAVVKDPNIIYVGTASGGLWKSVNGGLSWKPIFDEQPVSSIGAVAIQQSNPDVIWAGTGEGNPRNSLTGGYGVYKSIDGGVTWQSMGLEKTRNIHRIIIDKDNPDVVYVGAIGSPWGEHPERGVFKTTDGGKTWTKSLYVNNSTGCADLVVDPSNPNKLIAAMWEHKRKPWFFESGGEGSGIYITYDGGTNWKKISDEDGMPKGNLGRVGLAISNSNPNFIYALVEAKKNALYRSEDGGKKWMKINDNSSGRGSGGIGGRPFYYADIYVDPVNEYRVYSIFTYVNVSNDGGRTFQQLMPAYNTSKGVHPDHHAWWIHPMNPNLIMDGNDGGFNISYDRGKTWRFIENLPVGQFYHVNVDMEFPYNVYGGMQDNGSWAGPAYVLKAQGIRNSYWQELMFGDGFDVVPDRQDARYGYAMSQKGNIGRYDRATGQTRMIQPTHPDPDVQLRFNWNSALAIDPHDNTTIYFGSQFVHKSTDKGFTWEIISPDLTTNNKEKQQQYKSGGLTMDATGAENHCSILTIEPSKLDKNTIWVGTDDGNIQVTMDGGTTWKNVSNNITGLPKEAWVAQIRTSAFNKGEAYVVVNNYRQFDFKPYLFRTKDYGKTWTNLVAEKDETFGYVLSVVQDLEEPKLLFLGTENGLYISIDEGKNWNKWNNSYPSVSTMDLVIHPREHDLVIGTFGRAFYVIDDIRPLRALASQGNGILDKTLHVYNPPTAYLTYTQQPSGSRFGANTLFNGENRTRGAMISYTINRPKKSKETEQKSKKSKAQEETTEEEETVSYDSLFIRIYANEQLIRTMKYKAPKEDGLHRFYWQMREKGVKRPSRKISTSENEPSGVTVLPGVYTVELEFGGMKEKTELTVEHDPRFNISRSVLEEKYNLLKKLQEKMGVTGEATHQLAISKKIVSDYQKRIKDQKDDDKNSEILETHKEMLKTIDSLFAELLGKVDKRQGITASKDPSTISYLTKAYRYVSSLQSMPGETERTLIQNADKKVGAAIDKINAFYATEWKEYQSKISSLDLSPFKETKSLDF